MVAPLLDVSVNRRQPLNPMKFNGDKGRYKKIEDGTGNVSTTFVLLPLLTSSNSLYLLLN